MDFPQQWLHSAGTCEMSAFEADERGAQHAVSQAMQQVSSHVARAVMPEAALKPCTCRH